jgi:hypothetical protein
VGSTQVVKPCPLLADGLAAHPAVGQVVAEAGVESAIRSTKALPCQLAGLLLPATTGSLLAFAY